MVCTFRKSIKIRISLILMFSYLIESVIGISSAAFANESIIEIPEKTVVITASVKWAGLPDGFAAPHVELSLMDSESIIIETKTLYSGTASVEFSPVNKLDSNGNLIGYLVSQQEIEGFNTEINGFEITNTYIAVNENEPPEEEQPPPEEEQPPPEEEQPPPEEEQPPPEEEQPPTEEEQPPTEEEQPPTEEEQLPIQEEQPPIDVSIIIEKIEIEVAFVWAGIPEGLEAPEATVNLLSGSSVIESKVLHIGESTLVFAPVNKLDDKGNEIAYTITQDILEGYETVVTENNGFEIKNTYISQTNIAQDEDPTYSNEQTFIPWSPIQIVKESRPFKIESEPSLLSAMEVLASTTDEEGTYPYPFTQVGDNIRNPDPVRIEYTEGWLTKYASESTNPGEFNINLKIEGKTTVTTQTTDIVIVLDNSNSMASNNRLESANTAAEAFITGLLDPDNNGYDPLSPIRIALVTYGTGLVPGNSYYTLTYNGAALISELPTAAVSGGTFTQMALVKASEILATSGADKKIILVLSDGVPTYSYQATAVVANTGTYNLVDYHNVANFPTAYKATTFSSTIKGTGRYYTLEYGRSDFADRPYTVGAYTVTDNGFATMSQALLMKPYYTIYGVGIELSDGGGNGTATLNDALNVMKNISTSGSYYYNASQASQLTEILNDIATEVTKTINNGSVTDPMGTMINLNTGIDGVFNSGDYVLTGSSAGVLDGVVVSENPTGTIKITGLTLGAGEWVNLQYKVNIRTEDPDFVPDIYYETNGTTYLTPIATNPGTTRDFMVPSVKAPGVVKSGNKVWNGDVAGDRPSSITLSLYRTSIDVLKTKVGNSITVSADLVIDNIWPYEFPESAAFDNHGHTFTYTVEEDALDAYSTAYDGDNIINTLKTGQLEIKKVDNSGTVITIGTATFQLKQGATVVMTETTVAGIALFENIRPGTYTLIETIAPAGYELDPTEYTVVVQLNASHVIEVIVKIGSTVIEARPVPFVNDNYGSIQIKKTGIDGKALPGAEFDLYIEVSSGEPGAVKFTIGSADVWGFKINTLPLITDSDGKTQAVTGLLQGSYFAVETKAPADPHTGLMYNLLEEPIMIQLEYVDSISDLTVLCVIPNTLAPSLPSTGGPGTVLFTVIGIVMMAGALIGYKRYYADDKNNRKGEKS